MEVIWGPGKVPWTRQGRSPRKWVPVTRSVACVKSVAKQDFCDCSISCIVSCCQSCTFCSKVQRQSQKKDTSPSSKAKREINIVKGVSIVDHCVFAPNVPSAPSVAHAQLVGGRLTKLLADMVPPGRKSEGSVLIERWLHFPI